MPILILNGCPPEPLGNYLKALGVFRLVAEQADPSARAWWEGGVLRLLTRLDNRDIEIFFSSGATLTRQPTGLPQSSPPGEEDRAFIARTAMPMRAHACCASRLREKP